MTNVSLDSSATDGGNLTIDGQLTTYAQLDQPSLHSHFGVNSIHEEEYNQWTLCLFTCNT